MYKREAEVERGGGWGWGLRNIQKRMFRVFHLFEINKWNKSYLNVPVAPRPHDNNIPHLPRIDYMGVVRFISLQWACTNHSLMSTVTSGNWLEETRNTVPLPSAMCPLQAITSWPLKKQMSDLGITSSNLPRIYGHKSLTLSQTTPRGFEHSWLCSKLIDTHTQGIGHKWTLGSNPNLR